MRDGRPNPDIWGNIITCVEIGQGIYCIIGRDKRGIEMPKETAFGAGLGSVLTLALGTRSIWICCLLLTVSFSMMFVPERKE